MRTEPKEYTVTEGIAKKLYETLHHLVDSSYQVVTISNTRQLPEKGPKERIANEERQRDFDIKHWGMVGRYYNACMDDLPGSRDVGDSVLLDLMEEVNRPFAVYDSMVKSTTGDRVDTFRPSTNTSERIDSNDEPLVRQATVNLALYGIFPIVRYGIGASQKYSVCRGQSWPPRTQLTV